MKRVLYYSILLSKFANSNIYKKNETIKILNDCFYPVDGYIFNFLFELGK